MNWIQQLFAIAMLKDKPKRRIRERSLLTIEKEREKSRLCMAEKRRKLKEEKRRAIKD